jgi:hypothetical protein
MQSPEARKDRVQQAADRKGYAKKLRTLPKDARRAIQVERLARRQKGIVVAGSTASQLTNIAEGRIRLIGNAGKRKDKLTPGQIGAMARTMSESARRLKVGMATGRRGRMRYNPNALQIATGTAARKIRGARVGGVVRKGKASTKPQTFNDTLKKANPAAYEKLQKREAKVAKAQQRKAAKLANRNSASAPTGSADARARRSARLSGVSGRIAGRARRVYAQQGERVGAGTLPNRGLFAAPMGRRSTGTNAATSGLQPGKKARGARPTGTIAKPRGMKPGALKASRIARGRAKRAAEPLGTCLNRVYIRAKAIEARNDPRTLRGKNTSRNGTSFLTARKAASFLGKGDDAWKGRARLSTGKRSGATSALQPGKKIRGARLSGTIAKPGKLKAGSAGGKQLTQKERWAKRAELRRQQAAKAEARARALYDKHRRQGDTAFWTQPGLHSQREKARAGLARSFAETEKAKRLLENARQLDKLAATNKGDTERRRQTQRDALSVNKGDQIYTAMYGTGRVVKINKKTITYYSESRGTTFNVDKSWVKPGADPYNR